MEKTWRYPLPVHRFRGILRSLITIISIQVPCHGVLVVISFKTIYIYIKTIIRFGFCEIRNNQSLGKCYQPWPSARLITLTLTLIILNITKTSSNNCLYIDLAKAKCEASILYTFNYLKPKKLKQISFNLSKPKNSYLTYIKTNKNKL